MYNNDGIICCYPVKGVLKVNIEDFNSRADQWKGKTFEGSGSGGPKVRGKITSINSSETGAALSVRPAKTKAGDEGIWSLRQDDFPATETETEIVFRNGWRITK